MSPAVPPPPPSSIFSQLKHDIHKFHSITSLTDENWVQFKFELLAALEEHGLYDVVNGDIAEPIQSDPSWRAWKDKDISAKAQIIQNVSKDVQPTVYNCKTSVEVWNALKDEFESKNLDKIVISRNTYDHLAYIEGTPMRDYINRLNILREQLVSMGDKITDTSHALRLICLLPPSWEGVCQVLHATAPTVSRVKDRLMAEEQARKTASGFANSGGASALAAALQDPNMLANLNALITTHFGSVQLKPGVPSLPGGSTRSKRDNSDQNMRKLRRPDLQCTNPHCLKKGHTINRCWAKGGGQEGRGPKNNKRNHENTKRDPSPGRSTQVNLTEFPNEAVDATALMMIT